MVKLARDEVSRFQRAPDQPVSPHSLRSFHMHHFTRMLWCQALDLLPLPPGNSRSSAVSLIHGLSRIFRSSGGISVSGHAAKPLLFEVALGGSRGASRRTPRNSAWRASSCGSALG